MIVLHVIRIGNRFVVVAIGRVRGCAGGLAVVDVIGVFAWSCYRSGERCVRVGLIRRL